MAFEHVKNKPHCHLQKHVQTLSQKTNSFVTALLKTVACVPLPVLAVLVRLELSINGWQSQPLLLLCVPWSYESSWLHVLAVLHLWTWLMSGTCLKMVWCTANTDSLTQTRPKRSVCVERVITYNIHIGCMENFARSCRREFFKEYLVCGLEP